MSSRDSSTNHASSGYSTVIQQSTFRADKSENYKGERIERLTAQGGRSVTYNHHARGYEAGAPTPNYSTHHPSTHRGTP